jgi:hypothetical protein
MTDDAQVKALVDLRIGPTRRKEDVWLPTIYHVEDLHREITDTVLAGLRDARESTGSGTTGVVIEGQRGSGKTHLLGWIRERTLAQGGYFFLVSMLDSGAFWRSTVISVLDGLSRESSDDATQAVVFLRRLTLLTGVPYAARQAIIGEAPLTGEALRAFVQSLWKFDRRIGPGQRDTAIALVLRAVGDFTQHDIGYNFLLSRDESEPGERGPWGMRPGTRDADQIVADISHLLSLTGPSVIAIDQIDALLALSERAAHLSGDDHTSQLTRIEEFARGLMDLHEITHKTLTVVAALPKSWILIKENATDTVQDRFRVVVQLKNLPNADVAKAILVKRFEPHYREIDFDPPWDCWPVGDAAFKHVRQFTARQLLQNVDNHIRQCVLDGQVRIMTELSVTAKDDTAPVEDELPAGFDDLAKLDRRFAALQAQADVADVLDPSTEDVRVPRLVRAGLAVWIAEHGGATGVFAHDELPSSKPPLHARLRRTLDADLEDEAHWAFRAIAAAHPRAVQVRLRAACAAAGLAEGVDKRRLFILRRGGWPTGRVTDQLVHDFTAAGGRRLDVSEQDLRVLDALSRLLDERPPHLDAWLADRKPSGQVAFLKEALSDADADADATTEPGAGVVPSDGVTPLTSTHSTGVIRTPRVPSAPIGVTEDSGQTVYVALEALRKHIAIFAGSGSGKTVLIRRLVEECALRGVSAIVLDPNNDLARLGDGWPTPPPQWRDGDATKAREYLENTDVVVWTPGWTNGRPLSFQPLPNFGDVVDDPDEFEQALQSATASLAPRALVGGATAKAHRAEAVLRGALRYYGRRGGDPTLRGFIGMLHDLPAGISDINNATKIAVELADSLTASMVNDPLFGGIGEAFDPGLLLTPPSGKRARISVISFIGLPSDAQRQSFVNQLQMALFAWIKRHPAGNRPLGGLFVMDEAQTLAPSGAMTACTQSTLNLASQARKYGLGLVFATQAPKGLHNRIPGNAVTQFFGLLNAPVQITAAREMAQAKGGDVPDISLLRSGQFYAALEGAAFRKLRTPLCLSFHPPSPLTTEEVVERAKR